MTWTTKYDESTEQTDIIWNGKTQATVDGRLVERQHGMPVRAQSEILAAISNGDPDDQIKMLADLRFGVE